MAESTWKLQNPTDLSVKRQTFYFVLQLYGPTDSSRYPTSDFLLGSINHMVASVISLFAYILAFNSLSSLCSVEKSLGTVNSVPNTSYKTSIRCQGFQIAVDH